MSKLHELLAVEAGLSNTAGKLVKEAVKTLQKENLFSGEVKKHTLFDDQKQHLVKADEVRTVSTTVHENLEYMFQKGLIPYWDAVAQKDDANQRAFADVVIDGKVILTKIAGTTLLGLESKLADLINTLNAIPTLAPGISWVQDENQRKGIMCNPQAAERTIVTRVPEVRVLYEATKEHPAQVDKYDREEPVGKYTVISYTGMLSPVHKAAMLVRLQKLVNAVKQARQRANCVEIHDIHIGQKLANYLLG